MNARWSRAVHVPLWALVAGGALAQDSRDDLEIVEVRGQRGDAYRVEEMSTATKLGLSIEETPQSVSVLNRAQLDDFALVDINDALSNATGVSVERVETDRTYYTARGFDITNFQVDGVGLVLPYGNIKGDLDTAIYERIEIVRGATSLMSGAGNPSATVNMIRKRPTEEFQASIATRYGRWDNARVEADFSGPLTDDVSGRFVAAGQDRESHLRDYAKEKSIYYGVMDVELGTSSVLTFGYSDQKSDADSPMWGAIPLYYSDGTQAEYGVSMSTSADWAYWNTDESNAFLDFSHELGNGWTARATLMRTEIESDSELFYMYGPVDPVTHEGLTGWASAYEISDERNFFDFFVTREFGGRHEIVLGTSWSEASVVDESLYDHTTGNGFPAIGDLREWRGDTPRPTFSDGAEGSDFTDEQKAVYAAARFAATDALSIVAGVRMLDWDSVGVSYGVGQDAREDERLPYLGAVYNVTDRVALYGSYTESFMPQGELAEDFSRLGPTRGDNTEVGFKATFNDERLTATFAVFDAEHENLAEYAALVDGVYVHNGVDFASSGFEFDVVGELAPGLQTSFGYTSLDIEDGQGESARPYTPEHLVRASASYRLPWLDRLSVGASMNWQDDIETRALDYASGVVRQEAYTLVDLFANYRFSERVSGALHVNNATDEKYIHSLYWDQNYYGAPRNASVSVDVRF